MAAGFEPEDYWEDPVEVLPENWEVLNLFVGLQTQWNWVAGMGCGGRAGLRYEAVYPLLDRLVPNDREEWRALFTDIQAMEREVMSTSAK